MAQEPQRRGLGVVQVVEHEQQRPGPRELRDERRKPGEQPPVRRVAGERRQPPAQLGHHVRDRGELGLESGPPRASASWATWWRSASTNGWYGIGEHASARP